MSPCAFEARRIAASHGVNVHSVHPGRYTLKVVNHLHESAVRDLLLVELDGTGYLFARDFRRGLLDDVLIDGDSARRCSLRRRRAAAATALSATAASAACRGRGRLR